MTSNIDAKTGIAVVASEEARVSDRIHCWGQEGDMGPSRLGRKEETNKESKKVRRKVGRWKGEVLYTLVLVDRRIIYTYIYIYIDIYIQNIRY